MARFYGKIGFAVMEETKPGIYRETYTERSYKGDVLNRRYRWQDTDHFNEDISVTNEISIIADNFANTNIGTMRYVRWLNQVFEIESATIDLDRHRITLSLGGIFNVEDTD